MKRQQPTAKKAGGLTPIAPVCFRLPKDGQRDLYFGGSRTFWKERVLPRPSNQFNPPIKSRVVKRHPQAKTGIRFIDFQSGAAADFEDGFKSFQFLLTGGGR